MNNKKRQNEWNEIISSFFPIFLASLRLCGFAIRSNPASGVESQDSATEVTSINLM
jgi:hypothetical protein